MRIYTRTGDSGKTSLFSGERVDKDDLRVEVYGTVDELNALLGLALAHCRNERISALLQRLQNELFTAGADLATRTTAARSIPRIGESHWRDLEAVIDDLQKELPPLKNFILPGGSSGSALLHLARTVCRRAERALVKLLREDPEVNPQLLIYLNRLSDFLFVMARFENISGGHREVPWKISR